MLGLWDRHTRFKAFYPFALFALPGRYRQKPVQSTLAEHLAPVGRPAEIEAVLVLAVRELWRTEGFYIIFEQF